MRNLEIDASTNLNHILNEIKTSEEDGLELANVPGQASLLDNPINRAIIEKFARDNKKEVVFPVVAIEAAPEAEPDDMGFVEGEDVIHKAPIEEAHKIMTTSAATLSSDGKPKPWQKILKNKFFWIGAGVVGLLILLFTAVSILPSATITITPKAESKDSQITVVAVPNADTAVDEANVIEYETAESSKEGSDQAATTGKKTIGNPAKGRVTITNQDTDNGKTFVAGTILTPVTVPDTTTIPNITFKLDAQVILEKAPPGDETQAGVNVTATKSGAEGNLPRNTTFKVGDSSVTFVFAENEVAFSGGDSKLATVASAEDRETLKKNIVDKLEDEAKTEIEKKQKDVTVIVDSYETTVTKETYDPKAVDAEAENLKATIAINVKAAFVDTEELQKIVLESLEESTEGYTVKQEDLKITLTQTDKDSAGKITAIAKIEASLIPGLSQEELKRNLAGKSVSEAGAYLDSLEQVSAYKVVVSPFYFRILGRLPFSANRITINYD